MLAAGCCPGDCCSRGWVGLDAEMIGESQTASRIAPKQKMEELVSRLGIHVKSIKTARLSSSRRPIKFEGRK